ESQDRYAAAEPLHKRGLAIREKALGPDHPNVGIALNNLAGLYLVQGRYAAAEPLYKRSLAIREKALGTDHPKVGTALNNLAALYERQGRFAAAEPLYQRSLAIWEKVLGPGHPDVRTTLNNLAGLYQAQGRYAAAEPLYQRSLAIREKALGPDHPDVGAALNSLAGLYQAQGRYAAAEPLYQRSLAIREKALGPDHTEVGAALNSLAGLYLAQGRYADAGPLYKRSLAIREKALGPDHPDVGQSLNNLAALYENQDRYAAAEPLFQRGLAIWEKALGPDHTQVGAALNNLAELYRVQGRYAAAEPLYKRSLAIREKARRPDHPSVGTTLNNLAMLYLVQGRYAAAEPLFKRSLAIRKKALGPDHPYVGAALNNLAGLYLVQEDWLKATEYYRQGTAVIAWRTRRSTHIIGQKLVGKQKNEAERSSFAFRGFVRSAYSLKQHKDRALASEAFQSAQWAAGSDTAASLAKMAARQATGDTQLTGLVRERQDLVDEWQKRDAARSATVSKAPDKRDQDQEARNVARIAEIDAHIAAIDKNLASEFPDYAALASPEPLNITEAQAQLRDNEALVLLLDTPKWKPTPAETFIWVVTKNKSRWVRSELGGKALADSVKALRCGLDSEAWKDTTCLDLLGRGYGGPGNTFLPFELSRAHKLYQSLFSQVEDLIAGKDLLIVPSGPLTQLPFQVLVTEKPLKDELSRTAFSNASWLIKKHAITVLPSVSSLKALRAHAKTSKADRAIVGFGNPLLTGKNMPDLAKAARDIQGCAKPGYVRTANLRTAQRATIMPMGRGTKLTSLDVLRVQTPLPETADELCAVARSAGSDIRDLHLGQAATETKIKDLNASGELAMFRMLHFATHGALAGELSSDAEPGLILTPPGQATAKDDGYLSASEVAGLKLDADWVILSACNTAGGESKNAEALSGLAKAFFYAGARSLLVSHWYVDSHATVDLITTAFRSLRDSPELGRAKAMQFAMLSLLSTGQIEWHPAYWAPFVVVGEGAG
ncbi:MAG: tetratricopeptide repeat protein, partial [Pseudomonadota bacterium]